MKRSRPRNLACAVLLLLFALATTPFLSAREPFRIPPPPPPGKVVRDIRGFIHRVAHGVRDASKETWGAIRERFQDEEPPPPRNPRTVQRPKTNRMPPPETDSFARSKDAVPYRFNDADPFAAPQKSGAPPPDHAGPSEGPKFAPADEPKPVDPAGRRPALTPDSEPAPPTSIEPPPSSSPEPKVTVPPADTNIQFARPVPGKRGLVYPPGAKELEQNMVDVGDFQTGQIVRDPRTGKLFRVP